MSVSSLTYDNMHRVTGKSQHLSQTGVQFDGSLSAGYDLTYSYSGDEGRHFQLAGVDDISYRAETVTDDSKVINSHAYEYDANGNLIFVNTSRTKRDGQTTPNASERKLRWDEENRLTASDDNGFVTSYWYDAGGERTVKTSGENAAMFVNAEYAGGMTNTAKFSLYVSPYLVASQGGRYTKHIYIGSQRIVSKIGDLESYGSDPRRIEYAGSESDGPKVDYKTKYAQQQQVIRDNFAHFDVPYNGADNNDYVDGRGFSDVDGSLEEAMLKAARSQAKSGNKSAGLKDNFQQGDGYEKYQFFYHPDHLGSSSFITNTEGEVVQHIEYVPYGEVFIEERNNVWNSPYLFNAKEFDEETGLYYYGARYYDSRLAMWLGVDPMAEKRLNYSPYAYCLWNPIRYVDPDGNTEEERVAAVNKAKEYKDKNPGNSYKMGEMGEPGESIDCSGMVRKCIMASGVPDPAIGSTGDGKYNNGVSLIVNSESVRKVNESEVRVGDILTLDTGRGKGDDGMYDHIGIIIDISEEGTISFIHSGSGGPKSGSYKKDGGGYWDSRVRGFFQWDTNDANSQTMTVNPAENGLPQFRQGKLPTFTEKLKENRIPIVRTFGEILSILIQ